MIGQIFPPLPITYYDLLGRFYHGYAFTAKLFCYLKCKGRQRRPNMRTKFRQSNTLHERVRARL